MAHSWSGVRDLSFPLPGERRAGWWLPAHFSGCAQTSVRAQTFEQEQVSLYLLDGEKELRAVSREMREVDPVLAGIEDDV